MSRGCSKKSMPHSEGWMFWSTTPGFFRLGALGDITEESFHIHHNINVLGLILNVQESIKRFGAGGGSIINLSSNRGS